MNRLILLITLITSSVLNLHSQDTTFKTGYALKGADTIFCKVRFCRDCAELHKHSVTLLVENEVVSFHAGGTITGYGVYDKGNEYHYGAVDIEILLGNQSRYQTLFLKKIVAGTISFYEHYYSITTTKRTTIDGVQQQKTETTRKDYTTYYIAKTDSSSPALSKPVLLESFRKKELERFTSDNSELTERMEKRFSVKELITILTEYNNWSCQKKNLVVNKQTD